jgi:hypothetical protein
MDIKQTFLNLTRYTYPHGTEHFLEQYLPNGFQKDEFSNYFFKIGDSKTMFTCHLDTACSTFEKVFHIEYEDFIATNGTTILGADDKAGMTVLLYLIENKIPGLYYFFIGEEVGCIGSNNASVLDFSEYNRCISFDRRGYSSVITHQIYGRCCSDDFAINLAKQLSKGNLDFYADATGVVTDSASFMTKIPECTNISVGYHREHTTKESQNIKFLEELCRVCVDVDWESLPTVRESKDYYDNDYLTSESEDDDYIDFFDDDCISAQLKVWINDDLYLVTLKKNRIIEEMSSIYDWVLRSGSYHGFTSVQWDGKSCYLKYPKERFDYYSEYLGERDELIHVIDTLSDISVTDFKILKKLN